MANADNIARFHKLVDRNVHTNATIHLNFMYLVQRPNSKVHEAYATILSEIDAYHELVGHMPEHLGRLRDAIQGALIIDLREIGIEVMQ